MRVITKKLSGKASGTKNWLRRHPRRTLVIVVVAVLLIGGGIIKLATRSDEQKKTSTNPVVASYQKQLPALEAAVKKNGNDAQAVITTPLPITLPVM
jgi:hypothetical protein